MKRKILPFVTVVMLLACGAAAVAQGGLTAPRFGAISLPVWSPDGGKIAFVYTMSGNSDVYVVRANGSNIKNVSQDKGIDTNPVWSPDGSALVFMSRREGQFDIYRADVSPDAARVSSPKRITKSNTDDMWPAWSPDGKKIAYCNYDKGYPLVYITGSNGSGGRELFYEERACYPAFSADGKKLALSSGNDLVIFKLEDQQASGEEKEIKKKNITEPLIEGNMVDDTLPVWAPRGNTLAFVGRYEAYSSEIYTIGASGKKVRRITDNLFEDLYPRWSPDGKGVIYSAFVGGRPPEIFVSDPDSPAKERLTDNHVAELHPCFSPDGEKIIYVRRSRAGDELYIMDRDGSGQRPFLTEKARNKLPTVSEIWKQKQEERKK